MLNRSVFNVDGTGTRIGEMRIRVLSPAGVQALGQLVFGYNSESEQLSLDYVRVRKPDGHVVSTAVENAPEASLQISREGPIYSDFRQKHISVSALSPGDTLEYQVTAKLQHPLAGDHFWLSHTFDRSAHVIDEQLVVEIPKTRQINIKSRSRYSTEETATKLIYTWHSSHEPSPNSKNTGNDEQSTKQEEEGSSPDVQLSTFRSWHDVAAWYWGLLQSRIADSPELKAKAQELTQGATGDEEKARRLYAFVSQNIRYVSLSFGVGRFQPHSAAEVLSNEYGDCKDKHTLLATLLQDAGIASHAVLISSRRKIDPDVPAPSQFDHLITALEIKGKRIWLDSTIGVAPFGLIVPPLRDKQALLVSSEAADPLVRTPELPPIVGSEDLQLDGRFDDADNLEANFVVSIDGDRAIPLRIAARQTPQSQWKDLAQSLSYMAGFAGDVSDVKIENVESPELPLKLSYHYSRQSYFSPDDRDRTVGRNSLPLPRIAPDGDSVGQWKEENQLRVGGPLRMSQKITLHFTKEQHPTLPLSVSVSRDYGTYASKYEMRGDELSGERSYAVNVASLPVLRERDLRAFLTAANQDAAQQLTVKLSPGAVDATMENSTDAVKLNDAASARLKVNDYKGAEKFALKAVQIDPQSQYAWNNLGRAYLGEGDKLGEAEKAFRKQIEINPYDEYAYNNLGRVLQQLHRDEEAIGAFRKQIEIVPLDKWAHKNLGKALLSAGKYGEAATELERALQITPEDKELKLLLIQAYQDDGENEKAQRLLKTILPEVAPGFANADVSTLAMADAADPQAAVEKAHQALQRIEEFFSLNEAADQGANTASVVPALWANIGWAYFRQERWEDARRYLNAAWVTSQSPLIARRLGEVYEKQGKKELAIRTYAEGITVEGQWEGKDDLREQVIRLTDDLDKADSMISDAWDRAPKARTVVLHRQPVKPVSANVLLVFSKGRSPDKVAFNGGNPQIFERYESTIKAKQFPILYPDEVPQHMVLSAVIQCNAMGCSVVLAPPLTRMDTIFIPGVKP